MWHHKDIATASIENRVHWNAESLKELFGSSPWYFTVSEFNSNGIGKCEGVLKEIT